MLQRAALAASLLIAAATSARAGEWIGAPGAAPSVAPGAAPTVAPGADEEPPAAATHAAPAAPRGPQNEAWINVSHINGTPVPVGERNRYLYSFKKTNIAVDPFGLLFGMYDGSVSFAVSQNLALSVTGTLADEEYSGGYQVAATVPLYFRRTFSGPYLEPGMIMRHTSQHLFDAGDEIKEWAGIELLFGWQWMFDSGLNVQIAAGVARHLASTDSYERDDADANGYLRVGYAF